jgi:hypothetical protein
MPIVGVICPNGIKKTFAECYECQRCLPREILEDVVRPTRFKQHLIYDITELCNPCVLKQYYERTRSYHEKYYKFLAISRGIAIHHHLQRLFNVVEMTLLHKINIDGDEITLRGICDIYQDNEILELKSIKYPLRENRPLPHHTLQVQSYLTLAAKSNVIDFSNINKAEIVYFSDLGTQRFPVAYVDMLPLLINRATTLHLMRKGKCPLQGTTSWVCGYCAFNADCKWAPPAKELHKKTGLWRVTPAKGILEEYKAEKLP